MARVKVIGFEEHYKLPAIEEVTNNHPIQKIYDEWKGPGRFITTAPEDGIPSGIYDVGEKRIAAMDMAGIDVQILSHIAPGPEELDPSIAVDLARKSNDHVHQVKLRYPDRLKAFATLPMLDPQAAADELERCVTKLGFVGTLINGHVNDRYLDHKFFWSVFERAAKLNVPIFLHPNRSSEVVVDALYQGFAPPPSGIGGKVGS